MDLSEFTAIENEAAESLSKHEGELGVNLDEVPESATQILRNHPSFAEEGGKVDEGADGSVEGPYVNVVCGGCGTSGTFELSDICAGEAYETITSCLESNDWDYSDRVLCRDCKSFANED